MATGGDDMDGNDQELCSRCFQPCGVRQAKRLPCSHTLCGPCGRTLIASADEKEDPPFSSGATPRSLSDLYEKFDRLVGRMDTLQSTNVKLSQQVTTLNRTNRELSSELTALRRELTDSKTGLSSKLSGIRKELKDLQEKTDNSVLTELQDDVTWKSEDSGSQTVDLTASSNPMDLKGKTGNSMSSELMDEVTSWKAEDSDPQKVDLTALSNPRDLKEKTGNSMSSELKDGMISPKTVDSDPQKDSQGQSKTEQTAQSWSPDIKALQRDIKKRVVEQLKADIQKALTSIRDTVQSTQDSLQDHKREFASLETQFKESNTQVAFQASLTDRVTTHHKEQTLVCDYMTIDVGNGSDGYDRDFGVFRVPQSGLYCLTATTSPSLDNPKKGARLSVMVNGFAKENVAAFGKGCSTGTLLVWMEANDRAWVMSGAKEEYTFAPWVTSFAGVLVKADVGRKGWDGNYNS